MRFISHLEELDLSGVKFNFKLEHKVWDLVQISNLVQFVLSTKCLDYKKSPFSHCISYLYLGYTEPQTQISPEF